MNLQHEGFIEMCFSILSPPCNYVYGTPSVFNQWEASAFPHTVEPQLSRLVGTRRNSPDNRKYEY